MKFKHGDKVIILSGYGDDTYAFEWYEEGMSPWVGKEVTLERLIYDDDRMTCGWSVEENEFNFDERYLMLSTTDLELTLDQESFEDRLNEFFA